MRFSSIHSISCVFSAPDSAEVYEGQRQIALHGYSILAQKSKKRSDRRVTKTQLRIEGKGAFAFLFFREHVAYSVLFNGCGGEASLPTSLSLLECSR